MEEAARREAAARAKASDLAARGWAALADCRWEAAQALFGDRVQALELTRREYTERAASPRAYCDLFRETFGPVAAIYAGLAGQPDRLAALDRDFLDFAKRANTGPRGGPAEYPYE
jgi:hypothetical protein